MKLQDMNQFFQIPTQTYLSQELTVGYILSVLLQGESYPTKLIERLESEYPRAPAFWYRPLWRAQISWIRKGRLSDTVLYDALKFLESEKARSSVTGRKS